MAAMVISGEDIHKRVVSFFSFIRGKTINDDVV